MILFNKLKNYKIQILILIFLILLIKPASSFDKKDLKRVKQGLDCKKCNLKNANLKGQDLRGIDLQESNLSFVNFEGADLNKANLFVLQLRIMR